MATLTATPTARLSRDRSRSRAEIVHRGFLRLFIVAAGGLILFLSVYGFRYYTLPLELRPFSPLHSQLRSSGTIGLKLGILSVCLFGFLFLYPLRKRWKWLSTIGNTRRWLNVHVALGIFTPLVVTFHTGFRWHGVAGTAYWSMMAVALSGFVGRYIYAKVPRSISSVALSMTDLQNQATELAARLNGNTLFTTEDIAPLLDVPNPNEVRSMGLVRTFWTMVRMDVARPFQVSHLFQQ